MHTPKPNNNIFGDAIANSKLADLMESMRAAPFQMPEFEIATPEDNASFESSREVVKNLGKRIKAWKAALQSPYIPAIVAVLPSGMMIDVSSIQAEGHHGIVIEGTVDNKPVMIAMHQNNFVTVCLAVEDNKEAPRPEIGFHAG